VSGYEIVDVAVRMTRGDSAAFGQADCPPGKLPIAGGFTGAPWELVVIDNGPAYVFDDSGEPITGGWTVRFVAKPGPDFVYVARDMYVYAVCALAV
jgi:hypothetical protein